MIKLLRFLLGLCNHKWVIHKTGPVVDGNKGLPTGRWTESSCSKCGNFKYTQH